MRVVELESYGLLQPFNREPPQLMNVDHVLERAGGKEVLLAEPEYLSDFRFVVRVEDLADRLGKDLLIHGLVVVADIEGLEVEGLDCLGPPEPEQIDHAAPVSRHRRVVGNPLDDTPGIPPDSVTALLVVIG